MSTKLAKKHWSSQAKLHTPHSQPATSSVTLSHCQGRKQGGERNEKNNISATHNNHDTCEDHAWTAKTAADINKAQVLVDFLRLSAQQLICPNDSLSSSSSSSSLKWHRNTPNSSTPTLSGEYLHLLFWQKTKKYPKSPSCQSSA